LFLKKNNYPVDFISIVVYTSNCCDIDSCEAWGCCDTIAGFPWSECQI